MKEEDRRMRRKVLSALLAGLMTAGVAVTGLTGCGSSQEGAENIRLMVWSPQGDQSKDQGEWLQTCCNAFAEEHPEWDITFVYGVADEASSAGQVSQDAEASADVFLYANDNLTTMTDADALVKFGGKYREEIEATNSQTSLDSVTKDGEIYGVPFAINTWFMFYDKSVFSEEDVKNLDTMLEKGVVSFPFTNSWYLASFYVGNGCTLFGDGTDASAGVDFGGEKAQEVTDYLIDLESHPNFRIDDLGSGIAGLRDGSINAMFSGSWDAAAVEEALGENMGVAALPTYTLNGEEKQMYSYAGTKAVCVNAQSKYMLPAVELAIFLGNEYSQRLHYELENVVPTHTALLADEDIISNDVVAAINDTFNRTSILQPNLAEMANCWTPVENMGKGIRNGSITHENSAEQTEMMNEAMNSDGI